MNEQKIKALTEMGVHIATAIVIVVAGYVIVKLVCKAVEKLLTRTDKMDPMAHTFVVHAVKILLWVGIILTALKQLGVDITSFLAIFAAAGAAVALALKDSLSNFAGGLIVMTTHPFGKGDYISCGGSEGTVESIDLLYTTIHTVDNKRVTIPNGQVSNNSIVNYSSTGTRRVDMQIGISYSADIETAKKALLELAAENELVLKNPAPMCEVLDYADSAIMLVYRVWCLSRDYWDVKFGLQGAMKPALDKAGIEIPFPQLDVHMDK